MDRWEKSGAMKTFATTLVGIVFGAAFLWAGVWIFTWDIRMLRKVAASDDWPQAQGIVLHSKLAFHQTRRGQAAEKEIEYEYTVEHKRYTSQRVAFDLFDKSGGRGLPKSIIERYPPKKKVTVYYDPADPATAILEPGIYSPFLLPLIFATGFVVMGVMSFASAGKILWRARNGLPATSERPKYTRQRQIVAWILATGLIDVVLIMATFDPGASEVFIKVFGERPLGMSNALFVVALQTAIYLPAPWIFWHALQIQAQYMHDNKLTTLDESLLESGDRINTRKSLWVICAGGVFYVVVVAVWIYLTGRRGI